MGLKLAKTLFTKCFLSDDETGCKLRFNKAVK